MKTKFIKIFDMKIANALNDGGFSYIKETINENQTIFSFVESAGLVDAIKRLCAEENYQESIIVIEDGSLFF